MKTPDSSKADYPSSRDLQSAHDRIARAEASLETAMQQSLAARQRRKEAKEEARRAKKKLRKAKKKLSEARDLLSKAEEKDAIEGERRRAAASVKRRAASPPRPTRLRPIPAKKAAPRKRVRSAKRPSPVVTRAIEVPAAPDLPSSVGAPIAAEPPPTSPEGA